MATTAFPSATFESVDAIYDSTAVEQEEHILQQHVREAFFVQMEPPTLFPILLGCQLVPSPCSSF